MTILQCIKKHRSQLKNITDNPSCSAKSVLSIDPTALKAKGIQVLALDFDGVLNYHNAIEIPDAIKAWLVTCGQVFGEDHLYLHSNNNRPDRIDYIKQHFPSMHILNPTQKKPSPEGLQSITDMTGIPPQHIALVDDRLLTGMLAACQAGCRGIHITKPFTHYRLNFITEIFFTSLRWLERHYIGRTSPHS